MAAIGRTVDGISDAGGSIDIGNVSVVTPSLHPYIAISPESLPLHSREWAVAAASDEGMKALIDAAAVLAMTAADIMGQPDTLAEIKKEFLNPKQL